MKIEYTNINGYYLPNLKLKDNEYKELNKYSLMLLDYLKKNNNTFYQELLMKDKLTEYIYSVGIEIEEKVNDLIDKLVEVDGTITEKLKDSNQLLWVQKMNTCKAIAEEIVLKEYIYSKDI